MMAQVSSVIVPVLDQESAKRFYTETLGFELRHDITVGAVRWLTVGPPGQPDIELILRKLGPPEFDAETAEQIRRLVAKGALGIALLKTDDCRKAFEELSAKGVSFVQEPKERPWAIEAIFRDDSGNWFSLQERRDF